MTTDQTDTIPRALLDTLLERWQEVADAYKNNPPRDDLDRTYNDYRHIYLRNIRDLQHVLDTGRMPCSLMTNDERRRGDCGRNHEDEYDKHGRPAAEATDDPPWVNAPENATGAGWIGAATGPWGPGVTRHDAAMNVVVLHIAEALLDSKSEETRTWARSLAHELKREQIDLLDEIGKHLQRMALASPDISF